MSSRTVHGHTRERTHAMSAKDKAADKLQAAKGKVKKNTGEAVGNPRLEAEGRTDETAGDPKQGGERVRAALKKWPGRGFFGPVPHWAAPASPSAPSRRS